MNYLRIYVYSLLILFVSLVAADQISKNIALLYLPHDKEVLHGGLFSLHLIFNSDTFLVKIEDPFNLGPSGTYKYIYLSLSAFLTAAIIFTTTFLNKKTTVFPIRIITLGLLFILAGIWGNAIDHATRFGVVDFIRYNNENTIPIFNFADVFVWIGEFFLFGGLAVFLLNNKYRGLLEKRI